MYHELRRTRRYEIAVYGADRGTPEQLPEEYSRRSAVAWADEINTPLLIFHTTGDDKVSIKQADKLVKQLKKNQKDYEYVTFESNIHGDLRKRMWKKSGNGCRRRYFITFYLFVYGNVI